MWWHMRRNQISSYCTWYVMAHAQKPDFVLLRLKCDGTCAETRFRLTAFEMWWHMRGNQISSYCIWNVMTHAQKPDFVLLRLKCDGTCAETRFRLTAYEMWWHMRRNQISSYCVWNVMAHARKPDFVLLHLKCDDTCAETRFRLSAKSTSLFKSAVGRQFSRLLAAEVCASAVVMLDTPCSEVVRRVLATYSIRQFSLHFSSTCVTVCHHISTELSWNLYLTTTMVTWRESACGYARH